MVRRPLEHRCHQPDHGRYPAGARRCQIIDDLRKRERNGLIEFPQRDKLKPGDRVRILQGPFAWHLGFTPACERTSGCSSCWRCWVDSSASSSRRTMWNRLAESRHLRPGGTR